MTKEWVLVFQLGNSNGQILCRAAVMTGKTGLACHQSLAWQKRMSFPWTNGSLARWWGVSPLYIYYPPWQAFGVKELQQGESLGHSAPLPPEISCRRQHSYQGTWLCGDSQKSSQGKQRIVQVLQYHTCHTALSKKVLQCHTLLATQQWQ